VSAASAPTLGDTAEATDAAVNTPMPIVNIRRRPKRSPSAAPVSSRHANARLYALTVHSRLDKLACKLTRSTGREVVTTSVSSAVMNTPTEARTSVHVRWGAGALLTRRRASTVIPLIEFLLRFAGREHD
jgi:hypothetical protein